MQIRLWHDGDDFIVYDGDQIAHPTTQMFQPEWWRSQGLDAGSFLGRGKVHVVRRGEAHWVLRRFRRGGLVGKLIDYSYVWTGLQFTRPWREWHLLASLHARGLPVPRPVAAHVERLGLRYQGTLASELIPEARPMSELLQGEALDADAWAEMGRTIRRFHDAGVHHPDLNASNVLRTAAGVFFLVDFDRGRLHVGGALLRMDLRRLLRSFEKHRDAGPAFRFDGGNWNAFMTGYEG